MSFIIPAGTHPFPDGTAGNDVLIWDATNNGWVSGSVSSLINAALDTITDGAPSALDTLNELAAALGDDANFASTITTSIAAKIAKPSSPSTNNILYWNGTTWVAGTLPAAAIASGTVTAAMLAQMGASSGQALVWNGSAWAPATVSGGGTTVVSSALTTDLVLTSSVSPLQTNIFTLALTAGKSYIVEGEFFIGMAGSGSNYQQHYYGVNATGGLTLTDGVLRWNWIQEYPSSGYNNAFFARRVTNGLPSSGQHDNYYGIIVTSNDIVKLSLRGKVVVNAAGNWCPFLQHLMMDNITVKAGSFVRLTETT